MCQGVKHKELTIYLLLYTRLSAQNLNIQTNNHHDSSYAIYESGTREITWGLHAVLKVIKVREVRTLGNSLMLCYL